MSTVNEMGAFTVHQDGQIVVIFYRHISRMIYKPDSLVIITDDGGALSVVGRNTVMTLLEIIRGAIPETVDILLKTPVI